KSPLKQKAPIYQKRSIILSKRRKLKGRTQGATSIETREGENQYPSERIVLITKNKTVGSLVSIIEEYIVGVPSKQLPSLLQKFKIIDLNLESSCPESNFNKICTSITGIRKVENTEYTRLAKQEYIRGDFEKHFSSYKSRKTTIIKGDQEITRWYRKHKGITLIWDKYFD
ncbi:hypothetical protein F5882DRAFT_407678, partial [Hyaloscypha sp. PMI_1271]